ncbi:hypothetical protein [Aquamicrobium terrae]|uniref:DUF3426 domain-containing protein n=1 Tax=Aquamicrobium terrae TaxID=1324945 RepID=A0ABV2MWL2_9HYPH
MAAQTMARPVSGEIMTGASERRACDHFPAAAGAFDAGPFDSGTADIVDADYVTLTETHHPGPRSAEPAGTAPAPAQPPAADGMAMLLARDPVPSRSLSKSGGPAFWLGGLGIAIAAFWIAGGHALVTETELLRSTPQSALSISAVTSRVDDTGARPLLFVDGEAGNDGAEAAPLPPLEIRVTGEDGRVTRYRLGTLDRTLAPGERFAFSGRVEVPRNGVKSVSVAFAG